VSHEGFLHAIREKPDDDTHRLIYADWLQDHGQPERAEFIRVQCRLAALDEFAPERPELLRREYDLFAEHGADWAAPLSGRVLSWRFRRGFIERIKATVPQFLKEADWLLDFTPVRELQLHQAYHANDLRPLLESESLQRIESLHANHHHIRDEGVRLLADSPNLAGLTHLSLQDAWFTRVGLLALGRSPWLQGLRSLDVQQNSDLNSDAFAEFVWSCGPRLRHLGWGKGIDIIGLRALHGSPLAGRLESLWVSDADLGPGGLRILCAADLLTALRELVISQGRSPTVHPADLARMLAGAPLLPRLHTLALRNSELRDEGAIALARAPAGSLRRLELSRCGIGDAGALALADSALCASVTDLDFTFNPISVHGLTALAASPRLDRLRSLDVAYCCALPQQAVDGLLASSHLDRLAYLGLRGNEIEPQAFAALRVRLGDRVKNYRGALRAGEDDFLERLATHPPRCLRGLGPRPDTPLIRRFAPLAREGVGVSFELTHPDPTQRAVLLGYQVRSLFASPFAIRWEPSGRQREFYDAEQHGDSAEGGYNDTIVGSGERTEWQCGHEGCREHTFIATIAFRDGDRIDHDDRVPFSDRFFYFYLDAYCATQDRLIGIASFADK
jgi:uncharacterized protein (TIGR02996 family)